MAIKISAKKKVEGITQDKRQNYGLNIGSSSVLLIFIILCLVSFATLSIVSANADNKLTNKVLERTTAYYEACNQAEMNIADMDHTLQEIYQTSSSADEYFASVGHTKSYIIPISHMQSLQVVIEINYPKQAGETFYQISSWQVITN